MREAPDLDTDTIARCLESEYGLLATAVRFLPIGYDLDAHVYEVLTDDEHAIFFKVRSGRVFERGLHVPRALNDHGIRNVLPPLRTRDGRLWCHLDGDGVYTAVAYPFVRGDSAMNTGMSDDQWREFGSTLRALHDSGLENRFRDELRIETFALPAAAPVRRILKIVHETEFTDPVASRFAAFWRDNAVRMERILARAEELGASLQSKRFDSVLCHADIHAANILVGEDQRIWLIDWDGPIIAPRERDLLFVVGSRIARRVEPREEDLFFEGYGPAEIDPDALIYYRYERIIEDLGEIGESVLLDSTAGEQERETSAGLAMGFFEPGADIDYAETVTNTRWPRSSS